MENSKIKNWILRNAPDNVDIAEPLIAIIDGLDFQTGDDLIKYVSDLGTPVEQYPYKEVVIKMGEEGNSLDSHSELNWHSDGAFKANPFPIGTLYCKDIDENVAGTSWINMMQAYEDLDNETKDEVENVTAVHSLKHHIDNHLNKYIFQFANEREERIALKRAHWKHKLVKVTDGMKHLFFSDYIDPTSMDPILLDKLKKHCYNEKYMMHHTWKPGDLAVFSNLMTIHRRDGTSKGLKREIWKMQME